VFAIVIRIPNGANGVSKEKQFFVFIRNIDAYCHFSGQALNLDTFSAESYRKVGSDAFHKGNSRGVLRYEAIQGHHWSFGYRR